MTDAIEATLLMIKECFVYKLPPRSGSGYKAEGWGPSNCIWQGKLVVVDKNDKAIIKLIDPANGNVFAQCPVTSPNSVEPVTDSSRYFVLRLEDEKNGRHAFVGMGFTERPDAFDFNATLHDHARRLEEAAEMKKQREEAAKQPPKDYSIPQGQTITVNLKVTPKASQSTTFGGGLSAPPSASRQRHAGGSGLLPPPGTGPVQPAQPAPVPQTQTQLLFGEFNRLTVQNVNPDPASSPMPTAPVAQPTKNTFDLL